MPLARIGKAEHLPHPQNDLALDLDRNVIAAAEIGIQPGRQHLGQHPDGGAAAVDPPHEAGMDVAGGIRRDVFGKLPIDIAEIAACARQRLAETGARLRGNRPPHRARANTGDMIEHIVEHPVPLRAKRIPVVRIERLAGVRQRIARCERHAAHSPLPRAIIAHSASQ